MSYKNISSNELKKLIQNNENILLIDVRSEEEFEEVNIETSINWDLKNLLYNLQEEAISLNSSKVSIHKNS